MTANDDDEYAEIMESLVAMVDDARHEANVAIARGERVPPVALQYCQRLQSALEFAGLRFPSEWRVQ